jgi:hypothetical protein
VVAQRGPPNDTFWSVTVNGTTVGPIEAQEGPAGFDVSNGTLPFSVESPLGYAAQPSSGNVTIVGAPVNLTISFVPILYRISFTEVGLPPGMDWSVNVEGALYSSTTSTVSFQSVEGNHSYTVGTPTGYGPQPLAGIYTVHGGPVSVSVTYLPVYPVVFVEQNLYTGTNWSVTMIGNASLVLLVVSTQNASLTKWSGGSVTIQFDVSNGTYSCIGYGAGNLSREGSLTVQGQRIAAVSAAFPSAPTPSPSVPPSHPPQGTPALDYAILGAGVALLTLVVALLVMRRRRRFNATAGKPSSSASTPVGPALPPPPTPPPSGQRGRDAAGSAPESDRKKR